MNTDKNLSIEEKIKQKKLELELARLEREEAEELLKAQQLKHQREIEEVAHQAKINLDKQLARNKEIKAKLDEIDMKDKLRELKQARKAKKTNKKAKKTVVENKPEPQPELNDIEEPVISDESSNSDVCVGKYEVQV